MRRILPLALLCALLLALASGCSAADECVLVEQEALTPEARAAFAALDGARGVMLYADPAEMTARSIRMYAVLYGPLGQELSTSRSFMTLRLGVSGEPGPGYSVWRIGYDPTWIRRAEFVDAQGNALTMDGYEELAFVVEQALVPAGE